MEAQRHTPPTLLFAAGWWGFCAGVNGAIAPALAQRFDLSDAELSLLFGGLGLSALIAMVLGRQSDRRGRRRLLLATLALGPAAAAMSAISPGPITYAVSQLLVYGFGTTVFMLVTVMLSERPAAGVDAAHHHGRVGLVFTACTALPMLLMAATGLRPDGWRWIWALAAMPLFAWPVLRRGLAEPPVMPEPDLARGTVVTSRHALFEGPLGVTTLRLLVCAALVSSLEMLCRFWLFHHAVSALGAAPGQAAVAIASGGAVGLVGFPVGARWASRFGRVRTLLASSAMFVVGVALYYGPVPSAAGFATASMAARFALLAAAGNACLVTFRTLSMELVEVPLRGALGGWIAMASAVGWWACLWITAPLVRYFGEAGPAIVIFSFALLPLLWLFIWKLPEPSPSTLGPGPRRAAPDRGGPLIRWRRSPATRSA